MGAAASARASSWEQEIDRALQQPALQGARVGVLVVSARDGRVVYERLAERVFVPASNQKILTAIGALEAFGPAHRFETTVYADRLPTESGQVGWLAVRGGGDPSLTSEQWWRLAADLRLAGLRSVTGAVLLDDSAFDRHRWNRGWGTLTARAYHAPVSALAANYSSFSVTVRPGSSVGAPARVEIDPPVPYLALTQTAMTTPGRGAKLTVRRVREQTFERVEVSGGVGVHAKPEVFYRSVVDPVRYAGAVFRMQLEANGIRVSGEDRPSPIPDKATELLRFEGKSMSDVVELLGKYSTNVIAESLLKAMGARATGEAGSWPNGIAALQQHLATLRIPLGDHRLTDGSGLSRSNRLSPRLIVTALQRARGSFRFGGEFVSALPIAGTDGTLRKRAQASTGRIRAKTGLLDGVLGLSGYAERSDGNEFVFSILVNDHKASDEAAMAAVDNLAAAIVLQPPGLSGN